MTYILKRIVFLIIAFWLSGQQLIASENFMGNSEGPRKKYHNRRLLVRYKEGTSLNTKDAAHFSVGAYVVKSFELPTNLEVVEVAKGISLDVAQELYREDPNVLYVEPDYVVHAYLEPPPLNPNPPDPTDPPSLDPRYTEQWGLNNEGQTGGTADVDINAPEMWEKITGDKNIVIAVIDTGVNYDHPDLAKQIWVNPGEIAGNNIDDDRNGVIDDIHGFNAISDTGDPMDDHGHGSHCSGIIGAESQNTEGGRGVMQDVTIIGCKFISSFDGGSTSDAIECLDYLRNLKTRAENPVNIIATNNSWGSTERSQALQDAIKAHQDAGILFVAAASNDGADNDIIDTYPADFPLANVISVGAIDNTDDRAWFSNWGKRTVHTAAPGVDILSTILGSDYELSSGTSMAAPFVTGLVGMIKANNPDLNFAQVKNLLIAGGVPNAAFAGKSISGRRIRAVDQNGLGSLTCQDQIVSGRLSPSQDRLLIPIGEKLLLAAININCASPNGDIVVPFSPGNINFLLEDHGKDGDSAYNDGTYTKEWIATQNGRYEFIFPENDKVIVNVYDPSLMFLYVQQQEENFQYRQIEGTALDAQDDWATTIDAPFPIHFGSMAQGFDLITIGSNGGLSVTDTNYIGMTNMALPLGDRTSLIAPFWDDLNPEANGDVYYATLGEAPNREFVVEWRDVSHYSFGGNVTFQVVFFENSSDILFNYLDVDFGHEDVDGGASATIGIQTTADKYIQIAHDSKVLQQGSALRFTAAESISTPPATEPSPEPQPEPLPEPAPLP